MARPSQPSDEVIVVGAGIAGCFLALFLARRGYKVQVLEKRPDFRVKVSDDTDA